jgi:hypothetical protein
MRNREDLDDLLKVYAIERQDDSTALVLGFSMATAAFTYIIAAFVFIDGSGHHSTATLRLLAPLVPTAVAGFLTLNGAATLIRSAHLQHIEAHLRRSVPIATFHTDARLVWSPERIDFKHPKTLWQPPRIRHAFTAITLAVYGIVYLTMAGFTAYMIYSSPWTRWKVVAAVIYGVVEITILLGVTVPLFNRRFQYNATAVEKCPTCGSTYDTRERPDRPAPTATSQPPLTVEEAS